MRRKATFLYELEIDPSEVSNFNELIDISRQNITKDNCLNIDLEINVIYEWDKGQMSGVWEDSYPPYFEMEIEEVLCNNVEIIELLENKHIEELQDYCENECLE